ncbi:hypothetical protein AB3N59_00265 [Leptospira sp. WS92.C1]
MNKKIFPLLLSLSLLLGIVNCNALASSEQICSKDIEEFDKCYTFLLLTDPGCTNPSLTTCGFAMIELAKEICRGRMKQESCRAHR